MNEDVVGVTEWVEGCDCRHGWGGVTEWVKGCE